MGRQKRLQDLTIKDNFMFGAVMSIEENCIAFLEMVLGFPIEKVVVSKERSMIYHPEYRGVRLDIYARDEKHTHYNVEMQARRQADLGKRSRYYHSQIDVECLEKGLPYEELPNTFVIFICDFDPFGEHLYCYLKFVTADLEESEEDFQDKLVKRFQETIHNIKADREMGERYMIFEEMLREEKQEGRQEGLLEGRIEATREGIFELLEDLGEVPDKLRDRMEALEELGDLKFLFKLAVKADSIQNFVKDAENYLQTKEKHE